MQLSKERLQHFVNNMPEKIDVVELIDKILLMGKIEQASDPAVNQHIVHDKIEKEIDLWG